MVRILLQIGIADHLSLWNSNLIMPLKFSVYVWLQFWTRLRPWNNYHQVTIIHISQNISCMVTTIYNCSNVASQNYLVFLLHTKVLHDWRLNCIILLCQDYESKEKFPIQDERVSHLLPAFFEDIIVRVYSKKPELVSSEETRGKECIFTIRKCLNICTLCTDVLIFWH